MNTKNILVIFAVYAATQLTKSMDFHNWFITELIRGILCISIGLIVAMILNKFWSQ